MTQKEMTKKSIVRRGGLTYFAFFILGLLIVGKLFYFNYVIDDELKEQQHKLQERNKTVEATRGKILGSKGEILAVSIPSYNIYLDLHSNKTDSLFNLHVDTLAHCISQLFKDRSQRNYKKLLQKGRADKRRGAHYLLKRNVSYLQLQALKSFPLLNMGKHVGGLIAEERLIRRLPYGSLAKRTIGIFNRTKQRYLVGLEGAFDSLLQGTNGISHQYKTEGGRWMPIAPATDTAAINGLDILTTIDVEIQDIAERALMDEVVKHGAKKGSVIVMDVATGAIVAMANLGRDKNNKVVENFNYAIADGADPGSTFKAVSMLVALDDGLVNMNDSVVTGNGSTQFCRHLIRDTHKIGNGHISLSEVITHSSNVGISKIIHKAYHDKPQKFIDGIYRMNMQQKTGIPLGGERAPYIKNTKDKSWSCTSLPWISYGYELIITPLQTLCFYNAVANGGKRMAPMLVKELRQGHETIKSFAPQVVNEHIANPQAIKDLQSMLRGVVTHGTGKRLKNMAFPIAGKTGTAQIANSKQGYDRNRNNYQSSFVGYFPSDKPRYSCIVVISNTTSGHYYGGTVALPVFKTIANRLYTRDIDNGLSAHKQPDSVFSAPNIWYSAVSKADYTALSQEVDLDFSAAAYDDEDFLVCLPNKTRGTQYQSRPIDSTKVPKVIGMTATDAVALCERLGLQVKLRGKGLVHSQTPSAGAALRSCHTITLQLKDI